MVFEGLERTSKLNISGSMNTILKSISKDVVFEEIFQDWYTDKFKEVDGKIQYVTIKTDERLDIDVELLEDIKKVFEERFNRKIEKVKVYDVARMTRQKHEKATDKQIKYAKKLYKKVYEEAKNFDDREYTKHEMVELIGELKDKFDKIQNDKYGGFKVIDFKIGS